MNKPKLFFTVGSTYPLDRLISRANELGAGGKYEIFAQIGESSLSPKNIKWRKFIEYEELVKKIEQSDIVISHAGVGTILECISKKKKLLLFPRLSKYGEAVDDHQLEICKAFKEQFGVEYVLDAKKIAPLIKKSRTVRIKEEGKLAKEIRKILVE